MARRSSSGASWGTHLHPAYYIRRPKKFAFVCLFFIAAIFFVMDRHSAARELELLEEKLDKLKVDRQSLEEQLNRLLKTHDGGDDHQGTELFQGAQDTNRDGNAVEDQAQPGGAQAGGQGEGILPDTDPNSQRYGQLHRKFGPSDTAKILRGETQSPEELVNEQRREAVRQAFLHAWKGYEEYAWGMDELQPVSRNGKNSFGGLGATIVDALDTAYIMGFMDIFEKGKFWVLNEMKFDKQYDASVFETTIRVLGGLLSAYDLSGDKQLLSKAKELADRLLPAWRSPTGIPYTTLNLASGRTSNAGWSGFSSILADLGTETLEFVGLSQRTQDPIYKQTVEKTITYIRDHIFPENGLLPIYINPETGLPVHSKITFGAMGDSFYEYLLKAWIQGGKTEEVQFYWDMWKKSMKGLKTLVQTSNPSGYVYLAEKTSDNLIPKMDHLACFAAGMIALGAEGPEKDEYLELAEELAKTCYGFYEKTSSKLSGENYNFIEGRDFMVGTPYNILRPETVESFMILYRKTNKVIYREWGWNIFQSFEKQCKAHAGYAGLRDVTQDPPEKDDTMQSFFLAETLKYLYLLFSDPTVIPLDQWVFNTEAHPLRIIPRLGESITKGTAQALS